MKLISLEDIRDVYLKVAQRGFAFALSKFSLSDSHRTKSSFNEVDIESSNWWIIPEVKFRWNELITGSKHVTYEEYMSQTFFRNHKNVRMVSIGSGVCSHELKLAEINPDWEIECIDFSNKLLHKAEQIAEKKQLKNISFLAQDIYQYKLSDNYYDIVFFHSSLHHFKNLDHFIKANVFDKLKEDGHLIINEYVGANRLQYPKNQIKAINECLNLIPTPYRQLHKTNLIKRKYYGSGLLRMIIADPSECVESERILPVVYKYFETVIEKPFGGNLLSSALKDISHNFLANNQEKDAILSRIFKFEDNYLLKNKSDFIFGIYRKKST